jgi:RNA polymerase sigma-70 factor (ECF subfamily)
MLERVMRKSTVLGADDFADLYESHIHAIFNYCLFRVGDRAVAEDLAADAFERAWCARNRYRPERADFTTWLFTIAQRVVIDWRRYSARRPLVRLHERQPDDAPLPEAQAETSERLVHLRRLIQALAPQEQELIALKFAVGMTNRQIACVLNKSETAIGTLLYRVMRKLRAQWEAPQ